jgi:phosphatidylinositol alpha 1,6-mannosyltransferase
MEISGLRIALFSGNYNYIRDGANQALNRLVAYATQLGADVRVYSPVTETPAFPPAGHLIGVRSIAIPGRDEYRVALGIPHVIRRDIAAFAPHVIHVSSPDVLGHRAISLARAQGLPVVASMHTRFETYLRYYHLAAFEPIMRAVLRRFYNRCTQVAVPNDVMAQVLRSYGVTTAIGTWARGVDTAIFSPQKRDLAWRRSIGFGDDDLVLGFTGRLVLEKGLGVFADTLAQLTQMGIPHRALIVGEGPAQDWLKSKLPNAHFTGFVGGAELGRAVAAMDVFFFPSPTEAFSNVTLEAMACGVPALVAKISETDNLVEDDVNGARFLANDVAGFASAIAAYSTDPARRRRHGAAALDTSKTFDWDQVNQAMIQIWLDVANAHG